MNEPPAYKPMTADQANSPTSSHIRTDTGTSNPSSPAAVAPSVPLKQFEESQYKLEASQKQVEKLTKVLEDLRKENVEINNDVSQFHLISTCLAHTVSPASPKKSSFSSSSQRKRVCFRLRPREVHAKR